MTSAQLAGKITTIAALVRGSSNLVRAGRMAVVIGCDDPDIAGAINAVLDEVVDRLKCAASEIAELERAV